MALTEEVKSILRNGNETDLRDFQVPFFDNWEDVTEMVDILNNRDHDYGSSAYTLSLIATAAFNYQCHVQGSTGFQASCADMDILRRVRGYKHGFMIIDYEKFLYPQYSDEIPGFYEFISKYSSNFSELAEKKIQEHKEQDVHPSVWSHWCRVAAKKFGSGDVDGMGD